MLEDGTICSYCISYMDKLLEYTIDKCSYDNRLARVGDIHKHQLGVIEEVFIFDEVREC